AEAEHAQQAGLPRADHPVLERFAAGQADAPPGRQHQQQHQRQVDDGVPEQHRHAVQVAQPAHGSSLCYRPGAGAVASGELEHARAPRPDVALARTVAAAAAVADAHAAGIARAAAVHAVHQLLAARLEPVGAADLLRLEAAATRLGLAEVAELVV